MRATIIKNWIKKFKNTIGSLKDNSRIYVEMGRNLRKQYEIDRDLDKDLNRRKKQNVKKNKSSL